MALVQLDDWIDDFESVIQMRLAFFMDAKLAQRFVINEHES